MAEDKPLVQPEYSRTKFSDSLLDYARRALGEAWGCYLATWPNGNKEYLLWQILDGAIRPVYSDKTFEGMCVHIDIEKLARDF